MSAFWRPAQSLGELKNDIKSNLHGKRPLIIIIGRTYCPYSKRAQELCRQHLNGDMYFHPFDHTLEGYGDRSKGETFPIIFVRKPVGKGYDHLPGGSEGLATYLQNLSGSKRV